MGKHAKPYRGHKTKVYQVVEFAKKKGNHYANSSSVLLLIFEYRMESPLSDSIVFKCKNGKLVASEEVCRKIDFLAALLNSGMKESVTGVVSLPDVSKEALELILSFVSLNRPSNSSTSFFLPASLLPLYDLLNAARFCLEKDLEARASESWSYF
jgi:hypothetical protein